MDFERSLFYIRERKIRFILGLVVVMFFFVLIISLIINGNNKSTTVAVKGQNINIELAKTDQEKQIGLSETKEIKNNEGMLFIFDTPDYYPFWMKNMKFAIDIIYINGNKVVTVIKNAQPPSKENNLTVYRPSEKADKVLEINAGLSEKYKIEEGSVIDLNNL